MTYWREVRAGSCSFNSIPPPPHLSSMPSGTSSSGLEMIDLRGNVVETVEPQTFDDLPTLRTVDMTGDESVCSVVEELGDIGRMFVVRCTCGSNYAAIANGCIRRPAAAAHCWASGGGGLAWEAAAAAPPPFADTADANTFDCSGGLLTLVPAGVHPLVHLLDLERNRITSVTETDFVGLAGLTKLLLSDNAITSIQDGAFKGLPALKVVELRNNALVGIKLSSFPLWSKSSSGVGNSHVDITGQSQYKDERTVLETLDLRGNPLLGINTDPPTPISPSAPPRVWTAGPDTLTMSGYDNAGHEASECTVKMLNSPSGPAAEFVCVCVDGSVGDGTFCRRK